MKLQRIIVKLPVELLTQVDEAAYLSRLTREELFAEFVRKGLMRSGIERHVWISREEAAKRSGLNLGHLRKLCAQKYGPQGLARKVRAAAGMPTWEIREDANPAFAVAPAPVEEDCGRRSQRRR
ncbi:MAG: putative transposase [Phycisphaerales bacterium]|jgi:hypothetical protein|nr:putative transposase [Phycisphaerales bacterium]